MPSTRWCLYKSLSVETQSTWVNSVRHPSCLLRFSWKMQPIWGVTRFTLTILPLHIFVIRKNYKNRMIRLLTDFHKLFMFEAAIQICLRAFVERQSMYTCKSIYGGKHPGNFYKLLSGHAQGFYNSHRPSCRRILSPLHLRRLRRWRNGQPVILSSLSPDRVQILGIRCFNLLYI